MPLPPELIFYISVFGYWAVFIGALFEGETILVLGGLFAHQGQLSLAGVLFAALVGTIIGDGFWFMVGRYRFPRFIHSKDWFIKLSRRPIGLVNQNPKMLALTMRFMYGFRTLIPLGLGLSDIKTGHYFFYHFLGSVLWVGAYGSVGYFFGAILEQIFGRIRHFELILIAVAVLFVVGFFGMSQVIRRQLEKKIAASDTK